MNQIIYCPHCGIDYEVSSEDIGGSANCEACGNDFIIRKVAPAKSPKQITVKPKAPLGTPGNPMPKIKTPYQQPMTHPRSDQSVQYIAAQKSRGVYIILALLLGLIGIHNFYAGRYGAGAFQLLLTIFLGWTIIVPVFVFFWILIEMFAVKTDGKNRPMD
ncbi:MAG: NINE protein [Kiritimatiellae bacterium]|jgi:TM2 domain-containing membrane protein YozV|nr:NINE protein [Kiritimatiellia bacterium]